MPAAHCDHDNGHQVRQSRSPGQPLHPGAGIEAGHQLAHGQQQQRNRQGRAPPRTAVSSTPIRGSRHPPPTGATGSSAIPQMGQLPGPAWRICGMHRARVNGALGGRRRRRAGGAGSRLGVSGRFLAKRVGALAAAEAIQESVIGNGLRGVGTDTHAADRVDHIARGRRRTIAHVSRPGSQPGASAGNRTSNRVKPSAEEARTDPLCAATMDLVMARPSPAPSVDL